MVDKDWNNISEWIAAANYINFSIATSASREANDPVCDDCEHTTP